MPCFGPSWTLALFPYLLKHTSAQAMAESLAAVALAGNILQFTESAGRLVQTALRISRSGRPGDVSSRLRDLGELLVELQEQSMQFQEQTRQIQLPALQSLQLACAELVQGLQCKLFKIRLGPRRRDMITAEVKAIWYEKDILELESRINKYRDQILRMELRGFIMQSIAVREEEERENEDNLKQENKEDEESTSKERATGEGEEEDKDIGEENQEDEETAYQPTLREHLEAYWFFFG
ncbi:hypothetical protein B0T25DRAFT_518782 [Lasiosphaeria hispida]|uniref:Fungal N-terminal domain-containing protein n=1 Tax=Lasiosphaeria hispida TaxID=260671 RepID=A0AAJ0HJC8_9PEZI|nr:hypothetical protein B0T25DRAFT_518782 [Lasiosphaeria hispida]